MMTVFDIETMALPLAEVEHLKPEFTPDARLKDVEKIRLDLVAKEEAWVDKLALKAPTARILAIGYIPEGSDDPIIIHDMPEEDMIIKAFWELFRQHGGHNFVGHNILDWDIPFLIRRSYILGVYVPFETMEGRYLTRRFVDTMKTWGCGNGEMISLDMLSRVLGVGKKNGEGKEFAGLYNNPETRQTALDYCANDLKLTKACASRMGIE